MVGKGVSRSTTRRANFSYGEQTDDISIISPSDGGTVVHPGETISIEVEVASGARALGIGIMSPMELTEQFKQSPPFTFAVQIPASDGPGNNGPLIGHNQSSPWVRQRAANCSSLSL